jgi:Protein of unknown function (DUF2934)
MRRTLGTHSARKVAVLHPSNTASRHQSRGAVQRIEREEDVSETPFEEGAHDTLDADLRHRMISEAAYHLYAQRGYADGYDLDDWLQAETQIDHISLSPGREDNTDERASETPPTWPRRGRSETR